MMQRGLQVALAIALWMALGVGSARAEPDLPRKVERARDVLAELFDAPDREIPEELVERAVCIATIPGVIKGALGWGGRYGRGVINCRKDGGKWSPPAFVKISGGSLGFQIGAQSTDLVLFLMTERSIESLLASKFTLGGNASVAAGPVGRSAEASTDLRLNAEVYTYARSRGLFAGISLEGARLAPDQTSIKRYYGRRLSPQQILFEQKVPRLPPEAEAQRKALPK